MKLHHVLAAILVAALWGFSFVVIRWGLGAFPPLLLAALRFLVAALPAVVLRPPRIGRFRLILIGMVWFTAQFGLVFTGMRLGLPPGLASVLVQSQAFLTILLAALVLGERPQTRQLLGMLVAGAGIAAIALTVGGQSGDLTATGLVLGLGAAAAWAMGNVLLRQAGGRHDMLAMVVWLSLVPPLPLFLLSLLVDGPMAVADAFAQAGWAALACVLYLGFLATIVGYGIWAQLLKLYPAGVVAPYSLLVPLFGAFAAALVFGERFGPLRLAGTALVLLGLAVVALPRRVAA